MSSAETGEGGNGRGVAAATNDSIFQILISVAFETGLKWVSK